MPKLLLVLMLFLCGCAGVPVYENALVYRNILIEDGDIRTNASLKLRIRTALARHPKALEHVSKVVLYGTVRSKDGRELNGKYNYQSDIIQLTVRSRHRYEVIRTLHHELGHALESSLTLSQLVAWEESYRVRLKALGFKGPLGVRWEELYDSDMDKDLILKTFPSFYCLRSFGEYFAEHLELVSTDEDFHRQVYAPEYNLLKKMGLLPVSKFGSRKRTYYETRVSTSYPASGGRLFRPQASWESRRRGVLRRWLQQCLSPQLFSGGGEAWSPGSGSNHLRAGRMVPCHFRGSSRGGRPDRGCSSLRSFSKAK